MNDLAKNIILWIVIAIVLLTVFQSFGTGGRQPAAVEYSTFLDWVHASQVERVVFEGDTIRGERVTGEGFVTYSPETDNTALIGELKKSHVQISATAPKGQNILVSLFINSFPVLLLIGVWVYFMRQMQGGGGGRGAMSFGKSRARLLGEDQVNVTFNDVAGVEEAKEEVGEIVDFLRDPAKFQRLGGKIPRGVLMVGSPGTGKTLLAKAIAGEAKVPFFTISGSDFVEMFVGVGASRVRDMFEQAKKHAPCIIFIDEIDAVGRHRGAGLGGGHDEREQTLNQLLVEMDGFEGNEGVIVIAATNRPDVLDPALLRPGRFDRHVTVDRPTQKGRFEILKVHVRDVPLADDVDLDRLAAGTVGLTGADLANLVNEAALWATRQGKDRVDMEDFEDARDKVLMGPKREEILGEQEKRMTAYHESGHALLAWVLPGVDAVHKVTIIPRGRALGVTQLLPEEDRLNISERDLHARLAFILGGRAAEKIVFDELSAGAENDLQQATKIARRMVTHWGMSERIGPVAYRTSEEHPFLGKEFHEQREFSEHTAQVIDEEVARILRAASDRALETLGQHRDELDKLSAALEEQEEINEADMERLLGPSASNLARRNGKPHKKPGEKAVDAADVSSLPASS